MKKPILTDEQRWKLFIDATSEQLHMLKEQTAIFEKFDDETRRFLRAQNLTAIHHLELVLNRAKLLSGQAPNPQEDES